MGRRRGNGFRRPATEDEVLLTAIRIRIRNAYKIGLPVKDIATTFGVRPSYVEECIARGHSFPKVRKDNGLSKMSYRDRKRAVHHGTGGGLGKGSWRTLSMRALAKDMKIKATLEGIRDDKPPRKTPNQYVYLHVFSVLFLLSVFYINFRV